MLASHLNSRESREYCLRTSIALIIIAYQAALSGCKSTSPEGRCGLPDLCSPTVMSDPFPCDQNVPPKGVDIAHYGYTRPQWRVLASNTPQCCVVAESASTPLSEQTPTSVQPIETAMPTIVPAPQVTLSSFASPPIPTTGFQPYPMPDGVPLLEPLPVR